MSKKVKINKNKKKNPVKKRNRFMLCIVLKANKSCAMKWVNFKDDTFSIDNNTYFFDPNGGYTDVNGMRVFIYLEGASLPVHHGNVKYETIKAHDKKIKDSLTGREHTVHVPERTRIENLKFDSSLISMVLNRKLADAFTKVHLDMPNLFLSILLVIAVAVGFINIGMWFL